MPSGHFLSDVDMTRLAGTFLGDLDDEARRALLSGSMILEAPSGTPLFPDGTARARLGVLLDGAARAYLKGPDGRQLTVRYVRAGAMLSTTSGLGGSQVPIAIQAMTDCVLVELDASTLFRLVEADPGVAIAVLTEVSRRLEQTYVALAANAFASTRERVAGHLLDLAVDAPGIGLEVAVTQQQLADAIGTVREVIARVLRELRDDGVVATRAGAILISDADRLVAIAGRWRASDQLYRVDPTLDAEAYLEVNPHAVVAVDSRGTIVYANPSVNGTFGWQPRELIGKSIDRLVPPDVVTRHAVHLAVFFAHPAARPMGIGRDLRGLHADGSEFPIEISLAPVETAGGRAVFATIVDISYRARLREAVHVARSTPSPSA